MSDGRSTSQNAECSAESAATLLQRSRPSPAVRILLLFLAFLGIAVALHFQGFTSPMIYDSAGWIKGKADIYARHNLLDVIGIVPMRPLFMVSLYANYLLTGMDPFFFRLFNATILAASGVMLVVLIALILEIPGIRPQGTTKPGKRTLALFFGLWFVVHPLQTFVVLYIWQREAILACFFYFSALSLYIAVRSGRVRSEIAGYGCMMGLFLAGLMSKENLATLPIVLVVAEVTLFRQGFGEALKRAARIAALTAPPVVLYLLVSQSLHGAETVYQQGILGRLFDYYGQSGLTPVQVMLTECRVFFSYLRMILTPFLGPMQMLKAETVSVSLWDPPVTAVAVVGMLAVVAAGARLVRKRPVAAFGIFFSLITVAPESMLIPQYLSLSYRAILPMAGVLLLMADLVPAALRWGAARLTSNVASRVAAVLALLPLVCFSVMAVSQSGKWNPVLFWQGAYYHLPRSFEQVESVPYRTVLVNFGAVLIDEQRYPEAVEVLKRAAVVDPESPIIKVNLGLALWKSGRGGEGIEVLRNAIATRPDVAPAWSVLGAALVEQGNATEGIACLKEALARNPRDESARLKLTATLVEAGRADQALENLRMALEINPQSAGARIQLGIVLKKSGLLAAAKEQFGKALEIDPRSVKALTGFRLVEDEMRSNALILEKLRKTAQMNPDSAEAQFSLGKALRGNGLFDEAVVSFQRAISLKRNFWQAHANLGVVLLAAGRPAEAAESLRRALPGLEGNAELHNVLGVALLRLERKDEAEEQFRRALAIKPNLTGAKHNLESLLEKKPQQLP
ncbi:MAG: tetratricopeptide repeat protein [Desulfomonile tiedjei]|nr:tetratricopeptide repeat protein [Desulfomonile tiedjei]